MKEGTLRRFVIFKDDTRQWRWRLLADNSDRTIADSGQGYKDRADAILGARSVAGVANGAPIWDAEAEDWI